MDLNEVIVDELVSQILGDLRCVEGSGTCLGSARRAVILTSGESRDVTAVPVGISNRHVHLSRADMDVLFGPGSNLTRMKAVKQPGQFAAEETVTLRTAKGEIERVRVLGPLRPETQVELSISDSFKLRVKPPIRMSGDLETTPGLEIIGPCGSVLKDDGVIIAWRHIHMDPATAASIGVKDGQRLEVECPGERGGTLRNVVLRVAADAVPELHVDMEEANAFNLHNNDQLKILVS